MKGRIAGKNVVATAMTLQEYNKDCRGINLKDDNKTEGYFLWFENGVTWYPKKAFDLHFFRTD